MSFIKLTSVSLVMLTVACSGDQKPAEESAAGDPSAVAKEVVPAATTIGAGEGDGAELAAASEVVVPTAVVPTATRVVDPAAEELAHALARAGVRADVRRSELVSVAYCKREAACRETPGSEAECVRAGAEQWAGFTQSFDEGCLDALLDAVGCYAEAPCMDTTGCDESVAVRATLCDTFDIESAR